MVKRGSFHGLRKEFLVGEKQAYAAGVAGGFAKDALAIIQRRFFKRFPIELPLDEEPKPEHLAAVNDDDPDPDPELPDENDLSPEVYAEEIERLKERQKLIVYRKGQIRRWLAYQYMKDHDIDPKDTGAHNPYRLLLQKLTGKGLHRPRQKTGASAWRKTCSAEIENETRRRAEQKGVKMNVLAPIREQVAKEMFAALDLAEREEWNQTAKEEHEEAVKIFEADVTGPLSTSPKDRQQAIIGLTHFMQPILDLVCEATGWKASLVAGGPEPAFGGRLNMISVHSGTTMGDVKMNFGRCEHTRYKKYLVPMYGDFLRKSYSLDDCRSRALNTEEEPFECIKDIDHPSEVTVDEIPATRETRTPSTSAPPYSAVSPAAAGQVWQAGAPAPADVPTDRRLAVPPPAASNPAVPPPGEPRPAIPSLAAVSRAPSPVPSPAPSRCPSLELSPPPSPIQQSSVVPIGKEQALSGIPASVGTPGLSLTEVPDGAPIAPMDEDDNTNCLPAAPLATRSQSAEATLAAHLSSSPPQEPSVASKKRKYTNTSDTTVTHGSSRTDDVLPKRNHKGVAPAADADTPLDIRPSKRIRNGPTPTTVATSSNPATPGTPTSQEWFERAKGQFRSATLGEAWLRLLEEWEAFQEEQDAFNDNRVLSAKGRPTSVTMWIGRARAPAWRPSNMDPKANEAAFNAWWKNLQPKWRVSSGRVMRRRLEGDWSSLRLPGVNGFQSIVAGLFFWGLSAASKTGAQKAWTTAVGDCTAVLTQLRLPPSSLL